MNTEKNIKEVFSGAPLPKELLNNNLFYLKIDSKSRFMSFALRLSEVVPYEVIVNLKRSLVKFYALGGIEIKTVFKIDNLTQDFIDVYKDYIIGKISDANPIVKYVFEDSKWTLDEDNLKVSLTHGGLSLLEDAHAGKTIEKLVFSDTEKKITVTILEETADIKLKPTPLPVVIKKPSEDKKEAIILEEGAPILGKKIDGYPMPISDVSGETGLCILEGDVFGVDIRELRNGKYLLLFNLTDYTSSITCKLFISKDKYEILKDEVKNGAYVLVRGDASFDKYEQDLTLSIKDINKLIKSRKTDNAEVKRVELHLHTQMSTMDGISSAKDLVKRAKDFGHKAIAITDHGVVQAFPEAFHAKGKDDIKIIYGVEAYLVNDCDTLLIDGKDQDLDDEIIVFDIETTGLNPKSEALTEIGAVKIKNGEVVADFSTFVNPGKSIPANIVQLTGITDEMVENAPSPKDAVLEFLNFCGDSPIMAHNASFDVSFIREEATRQGIDYKPSVIDTLTLCRRIVTTKKRHRLNDMADYFNIENPDHHRAVNDAVVCAEIWNALKTILKEKGAKTLFDMNSILSENIDIKTLKSKHAIILAKNLVGLKNLYKLISMSHLKYFHKTPRIPKSQFLKHRDGLLIGSACEAGELYTAILNGESQENIDKLCDFYDYFEIQPLGNNNFMIGKQLVSDEEALKDINRKIVALGEKFGKLVVATGDVHFMNKNDEVFRRILMAGKGFDDADNQAPLYFRTTNEMLEEFGYLGEELARKVVIENTNAISDMIEDIRPVPKEKCPPEIEGSAEDIERMSRQKAEAIYGSPLPSIVEERMEKELRSIIKNGFAVMYMIAHKLVKKSLDDGYMVGSRGSVGSSFVAFLTDITEVNALPPHYVCKKCQYSEFVEDSAVSSGCDMADKACPMCGENLYKDGHDIPFETFLGFDGDKAPDIDLNFSGDYQSVAHKYTEELFGEGYVFRAGTIGTIADKTAFGYVKNYFDERNKIVHKAELARLTEGCTGVKRTTGQHPGGIIVVPKGHDIHEFTPVQHPADKSGSDIITTHFDYHSIDENLLKLDILGHDDPTVIKMLEDLTGVNAMNIPLDDKETMSLFLNTDALKVRPEEINSEVGTYAVPEFGTRFVRQMLMDTKPKTFSDLIRISGLSHGTDVWTNNAQDLVRSGTCTLSSCICTRDDIMLYLIKKGLNPKTAFTIMESVRKGKGLKPEWEEDMSANSVPSWYISSCKKIKYMFPKAHAVAYVTMAFRIAYFKVHYPLEFYMAYYSVRADDFDYELMAKGRGLVRETMKQLEAKGKEQSAKEKSMYSVLEICNEMYCRGISFCPIDLYHSDAEKFKEVDGKIMPPLNSLPGLGTAAAKSIVEARADGEFLSIDELYRRTSVSKSVIELLSRNGCLEGIPESSQMTLF